MDVQAGVVPRLHEVGTVAAHVVGAEVAVVALQGTAGALAAGQRHLLLIQDAHLATFLQLGKQLGDLSSRGA